MSNKKFLLWLGIIHLPFFVFQCFSGEFYLSDSYEYEWTAKNLFSSFTAYGGDLNQTINPDLYTKRPIGYPLLIGVTFFSPYVLIFIQNIASILGVFYLRKAVVNQNTSVKFDNWFLVFIAGSLSYFIYVNMMMSEVLLSVIICLMVFSKTKQLKNLVWLTVLLITGLLIKPVLYPFSVVFLLLGIVYLWKSIKVKQLALLLMPLLMVGMVFLINQQRTGVAQFSSIQRINLLDYNTNYLLVNKQGGEYASQFNDSIKNISLQQTYPARVKTESEAAKQIIGDNINNYIVFHLKGAFRFFIDPGRFDIYHFFQFQQSNEVGFLRVINESGMSGVWEYLSKQNIWALLLLGFSMLFSVIRFVLLLVAFNPLKWKQLITNPVLIFMGIFVFYIAFVTGPLGAARFAVPVVMLINIIVALQLSGNFLNQGNE